MTEQILPNSSLDRIAQDVAFIKMELRKFDARISDIEQFNLRILQTLKRSEETFDLRVARSQFNVFAHISHSLEHTIEAYQKQLAELYRGFTVEVVDGKLVVPNSESIIVTKVGDGEYNYAKATDPDTINNEGTEPFTRYFNENPEVFGERKEIVVNISTMVRVPEEMRQSPQESTDEA